MKNIIVITMFLVCLNTIFAQGREIIASKNMSEDLKKIATYIQTCTIPEQDISCKYFVRIAPKRYSVNDQNQIQENAILGTKPYVFFTIPSGIYGKSLLEIYLDIGYEVEDIIRWQKDEDVVAIIFCYPENIQFSQERNGQLPENWNQYIYSPTWENIFSLFERLALVATVEHGKRGEFAPDQLFFTSQKEKNFVLGFPKEGKQRIIQTGYHHLQAVGGSDWLYRNLLERKLSIFEHFRGNGKTINEIVDPKGMKEESGIYEFVGPNYKIIHLQEVAIVYLGRLTIGESYHTKQE